MPIEPRPVAGPRRAFLGLSFDPLDLEGAVAWLRTRRRDEPFAYVVTPNVDHIVRLDALGRDDPAGAALWRAYDSATVTLCDSRILARLARWRGVVLPLAPGSDLTVRVLDDVAVEGDTIALIGGDPALRQALETRYPALTFVQHVPPMGLLRNPAAMDDAAAFARDAQALFLFIAVGSPQQELIASRIAALDDATGCALCIGASLDFIVGRQRRAPAWVQRLGLEWSHRLLSQPGRLWRRYLVEGPRIFLLARRWRAASPPRG